MFVTLITIVVFVAFVLFLSYCSQIEVTPEMEFGEINAAMVCPHCQEKGQVRNKPLTQKSGISGGKATAALLTGGASLVAVGLSRKIENTQLRCDNCTITWVV